MNEAADRAAAPVVAVVAMTPDAAGRAAVLADTLRLPEADAAHPDWQLQVYPDRLQLQELGATAAAPLRVDFGSGRSRYRRRHGGGRRQLIARAVGCKRGPPDVIDATAGFGTDAFVLAGLGCRVLMLERSPLIAALLDDGLRRAAADPTLAAWLPTRLRLLNGDAVTLLPQLPRADVIYLDPMYPPRGKSARVKKAPRALQRLVGPDADADRLLAAALVRARRRVVVKRPKTAPALAGRPPTLVYRDGATRYDVYLNAAVSADPEPGGAT